MADCHINAIGGRQLYHQEIFQKEGIRLNFLQTKEIVYSQQIKELIPIFSIIYYRCNDVQ